MSETNILNKIKSLLGMEEEKINLAQMKLEDGLTIVESENFEAGDEIMIITEDGKVAMPVGDYKLEDGRMVVVKEEGIIEEVKSEEEKEEEEEKPVEEEARKEEEEEYMEKEVSTPKKVVEAITKESFFSEIEKLKKEIEELKAVNKKETDLSSKKVEEVELSEIETTEKITHNPENKKPVQGFKYAQNRSETTLDRVMKRLSK